ncbi:MAG: PAS domain S-box protein, partial [Spirochaetales bacterium]
MAGAPAKTPGTFMHSLKELLTEATRPPRADTGQALGYSQEHAVYAILIVVFFTGTVSLAPLIVEALKTQVPPILYTRVAMIIATGLLLGVKAIPRRSMIAAFCLSILAIGAWTMAYTGSVDEGIAWLVAAPLFTGLLLGSGAGLGALAVVAVLLGSLSLLALELKFPWAQTPAILNGTYVPSLFLDAFLLIAIGFITKAAKRSTATAAAAMNASLEAERILGAQQTKARNAEDARVAAEDIARRQEALFHGLVEHSADIVLLLDADGRVRMCGPAVLPLAGYAPDEFIGHDFFSFILEEQASDQRAMFSSSLVAGLPTF